MTASAPATRRRKPPTPPPPPLPILDFNNEETHWHRCPDPVCGTVWAHTNDDSMDYFARIAAHKCPTCGSWTGSQITVTIPECERFLALAKTKFQITGYVRRWSPQNGF